MGDFLQVSKVAVEKSGPDSQEIGVTRVVNLDDTPRVLAGANLATSDLDDVFRSDNSEWHKTSELGVLLHCVLIVLLNIVWKVVNGNAVVFDILHHKLLRLCEFGGSKRVGPANNGDDVDPGGKALHELDIKLAEASAYVSRVFRPKLGAEDKLPMAGRGDEVKHGVDAVVSETGITLDTRLLRKNVIVLPLQVPNDLGKAVCTQPVSTRSCLGCHGLWSTYLASLSIWSPKPGVSTMVREMRVPSSSNSSSIHC